jgi:BirA family biotin operon repressor/biotin-[acetyl-CoA-carboxylase] ligase
VLTTLGFSLLRQLADGEFHSGEDLAAKVGLTRARVSQVLKDAGTAGLALERIKGRGYRLLEAPEFLDAKKVRAHLADLLAAKGTTLPRPSKWSTRSSRRRRAHAPRATPRRARGCALPPNGNRRVAAAAGRAWTAIAGGSLTFSLGWKFEQGAGFLAGLSLAVGVAVVARSRRRASRTSRSSGRTTSSTGTSRSAAS